MFKKSALFRRYQPHCVASRPASFAVFKSSAKARIGLAACQFWRQTAMGLASRATAPPQGRTSWPPTAASIRSSISSAAFRCRMAKPCSVPSRKRQGRISGGCPTARPASARPGSAFCKDVLAENPAIEVAEGCAAIQVHPMGRQGAARNPAPSRQARRQARSRHVRNRLCRDGDHVLGLVRAPAEGRVSFRRR